MAGEDKKGEAQQKVDRPSLDSIFSGGSKPVPEEKDKKEEKKPPKKDDKKSDKPSPDDKSEKAKKDKEDKPEKDDKKSDKEEPKKKSDKEEGDDSTDDSSDDSKESTDKKEDKAKDDPWESDDNPYKKRYKDTANYATQRQQELADQRREFDGLKHQLEVMQKKQDGTWTEEDERRETVQPEDVARTALRAGKAVASRESAYETYGKEQVDAVLGEFHKLFGENSMIQDSVMNSANPVMSAFRILNRHNFEKKYGDTPEKQHAAITKEVTDELQKKIRKEILDEIREGKKLKDENVEGMSSSRGSSESSGPKVEPKATSLKKLFG